MTEQEINDILTAKLFPPVASADEDGLLCISDFINVPLLMNAYWNGIFPWPWDESCFPWATPAERGVIPLEEFHIPKSFVREMKKLPFELRIDTAFPQIIKACAEQVRPGQDGTWITSPMQQAYCDFQTEGWAHSFEVWNKNTGELAGGLYGVSLGGIFCGESMFHRESGASKFALVKLAEIMKKCGCCMIDTQQVTSSTQPFGAREISRAQYMKMLKKLRGMPLDTATLRNAAETGRTGTNGG